MADLAAYPGGCWYLLVSRACAGSLGVRSVGDRRRRMVAPDHRPLGTQRRGSCLVGCRRTHAVGLSVREADGESAVFDSAGGKFGGRCVDLVGAAVIGILLRSVGHIERADGCGPAKAMAGDAPSVDTAHRAGLCRQGGHRADGWPDAAVRHRLAGGAGRTCRGSDLRDALYLDTDADRATGKAI